MFSAFERMVALRYLRPRRKEGFISVIAGFSFLGIALGVATLIIVMSVMNGFREELMTRILGLNGHLEVYAAQGAMTNYDSAADVVRGLPGVVQVVPLIEGQVMATAAGRSSGAVVRGLKPEDFRARAILADHVRAGTLDNFKGDSIVIGNRLAERLGVMPGDKVTLISPQGTETAFGTVPRMKAYTIAATFEIGMYEYDNTFVFMPLSAAQIYFKVPNAVTSLEVMAIDPDHVGAVRDEILNALKEPLRILDWQQANNSFFNAIEVERNVMFMILTLIIVVAAFNIISSLIMLVKDKGQDIAILRTMGATRGMIMRIFLLSGASIGCVGTLAGFGLGLAFADNIEIIRQLIQKLTGTQLFAPEIYFLSQLPAKVDMGEVTTVVIMALALSFLATLYPSWRAARLDPVEALRYE
ncbi:MAG: lipoprotein-releasing ABC transporter permease subunit [Alphaproteobacteria bacterium]